MLRSLAFRFVLILGAALTLAPREVAAQKSAVKRLAAGTIVILETTAPVSSKDAQVGQSIGVRVKYDVVVKGKTLIKAGAAGSAQVTASEAGK